MTPPWRISVITASLNRREKLRNAIHSVLKQQCDGVEHIVQDGGSNDGTLDMLAEYGHLKTASEPDSNLYDAWNKGIARATGDIICILNSDDELPAGAFEAVRAGFAENPQAAMVSGPVKMTDTRMTEWKTVVIGHPNLLELSEQNIGPGAPLTNGRYITRAMTEQLGPYDIRYPSWSDRQFLMRFLLSGAKNHTISQPLYNYFIHEGSLTLHGGAAGLEQLEEAVRMARDGMAEAKTLAHRYAYRRWHSWAAMYLMAKTAKRAGLSACLNQLIPALKTDPFTPVRFLPMVPKHLLERQIRKGVASIEACEH